MLAFATLMLGKQFGRMLAQINPSQCPFRGRRLGTKLAFGATPLFINFDPVRSEGASLEHPGFSRAAAAFRKAHTMRYLVVLLCEPHVPAVRCPSRVAGAPTTLMGSRVIRAPVA